MGVTVCWGKRKHAGFREVGGSWFSRSFKFFIMTLFCYSMMLRWYNSQVNIRFSHKQPALVVKSLSQSLKLVLNSLCSTSIKSLNFILYLRVKKSRNIFLMLSCTRCLYMLDTNPLSVITFANIFSQQPNFKNVQIS